MEAKVTLRLQEKEDSKILNKQTREKRASFGPDKKVSSEQSVRWHGNIKEGMMEAKIHNRKKRIVSNINCWGG